MENATKALLMAAGVLILVLLLSALAFMYRSIGSYYIEKQRNSAQEELSKFNLQFEAYNRDEITGYDVVSLTNKIADFSEKTDEANYRNNFTQKTENN